MKDSEPNYFDLDQHRLDHEWLQQPRLYHQAATALAEAKAKCEWAKADRDLVAAELDKEIRTAPNDFGIEKITEPALQNATILQPRYKRSLAAYLDAKHAADVAQVEVDTLEHRKHALQKMVDLWLASYFSQPRASANTKERMDRVERDQAFKAKGRSK